MKKFFITTLAVVALLGFAGSSFALLCASDPVPAGTLLYPFVTGKYSAASTSTNPVSDRQAATTLFAITNVSDSAHIVHACLYNDFSYPLLDWNILLTGYDVITYNFADIMEGYLKGTGPATNPATGRPFSPTGTLPTAQGPIPSFFAGVPSLPVPESVGTTANTTTSLFGLCTNPTYTTPFTINPGDQATRIPEFNRSIIYNGLRKSQVIAENGWYGNFPPFFVTPDWLLNRTTNDNVWGYITADVVDACNPNFPTDGATYFTNWARPDTHAFYANNAATLYDVELGNVLIGDWFCVSQGDNSAQGNPAVHIEMDNQDILNSASYPKAIANGASFYRYSDPVCGPSGAVDDLTLCQDFYTGTGTGSDYTTGAAYFFFSANGAAAIPSGDFREPLPSAMAFRWLSGGGFDGGTKLRVWKEYPDTYPVYGFTYIYSTVEYAYYAWDEEEHVLTNVSTCPVSPCPGGSTEINQLPLEVQEVDMTVFQLPTTYMTFGWALFAWFGSNSVLFGVPGGYTTPSPNTYGTQAWFELLYTASGKYSVDFNSMIIGNYLCDGLAVASAPQDGFDVTDLGDVLY